MVSNRSDLLLSILKEPKYKFINFRRIQKSKELKSGQRRQKAPDKATPPSNVKNEKGPNYGDLQRDKIAKEKERHKAQAHQKAPDKATPPNRTNPIRWPKL